MQESVAAKYTRKCELWEVLGANNLHIAKSKEKTASGGLGVGFRQ